MVGQYTRDPAKVVSIFYFLGSAPVAFLRVALETPEWTSRDSNHYRQSVNAGKTNAIPTEPSGRLVFFNHFTGILHTKVGVRSRLGWRGHGLLD